jgi:hypothetical protein
MDGPTIERHGIVNPAPDFLVTLVTPAGFPCTYEKMVGMLYLPCGYRSFRSSAHSGVASRVPYLSVFPLLE